MEENSSSSRRKMEVLDDPSFSINEYFLVIHNSHHLILFTSFLSRENSSSCRREIEFLDNPSFSINEYFLVIHLYKPLCFKIEKYSRFCILYATQIALSFNKSPLLGLKKSAKRQSIC